MHRYDVWNVCAHTLLGSVNTVAGQSITLELLRKKPAMIEAVRPRLAEEAPSLDDGHIPGDRLGAAGFDSALFTHLKVESNFGTSFSCFYDTWRIFIHTLFHFCLFIDHFPITYCFFLYLDVIKI